VLTALDGGVTGLTGLGAALPGTSTE